MPVMTITHRRASSATRRRLAALLHRAACEREHGMFEHVFHKRRAARPPLSTDIGHRRNRQRNELSGPDGPRPSKMGQNKNYETREKTRPRTSLQQVPLNNEALRGMGLQGLQ